MQGVDVDPYERALYGSISGDVDSVLPVCTSWEDHVWAHVNALFESHVEVELWTAKDGRYWTRGDDLVDAEDPLFAPAGQRRGVHGELEIIFGRLQGGRKDLAEQAGDPYHVAQKSLILGQIADLLNTFVEQTRANNELMEPECVLLDLRSLEGSLTRFLPQNGRTPAAVLRAPRPRPPTAQATASSLVFERNSRGLRAGAGGEQPGRTPDCVLRGDARVPERRRRVRAVPRL